jgi:hypothetical protein
VSSLVTCSGQATGNLATPFSIPFDLVSNQILLKIGINGSAPQWFVLDSGAGGCVVDSALAGRLGFKPEGEKQGTGAGKGTVKISFLKGLTYNLPGLDVPIDESYVIDLSGQPAIMGRDIGGILGYSFFARYVVDVDFDARVLTIYGPEQYRALGESIPFQLVKHTPRIHVKVAVEGQAPADFEVMIDTGSQDAVDVDALGQSRERMEIIGGVGLGEEFRTVLGRADSVQIGSFVLAHPFGATGGVSLIGNEIWRRFHLAFDYAHERIFLSPGQHFSDAFQFDASGLDLRWDSTLVGLDVYDVSKDSPAWIAGIRSKDTVVAINGQPTSAFTVEQVSQLLTEAGREIWLTLKRGATTQVVKLSLRKRL